MCCTSRSPVFAEEGSLGKGLKCTALEKHSTMVRITVRPCEGGRQDKSRVHGSGGGWGLVRRLPPATHLAGYDVLLHVLSQGRPPKPLPGLVAECWPSRSRSSTCQVTVPTTQVDSRAGLGLSAVNCHERASGLRFFESGLYMSTNSKSTNRSWWEFSCFALCRYTRFLWSVQDTNG